MEAFLKSLKLAIKPKILLLCPLFCYFGENSTELVVVHLSSTVKLVSFFSIDWLKSNRVKELIALIKNYYKRS